MSRDIGRKNFYDRDRRDWGRNDYRNRGPPPPVRNRSRSPDRRRDRDRDIKRRSRSPRRNEKDTLDDNILSEISKLPEPSELWDSNHSFPDGNFQHATHPPPPTDYSHEQGYNSNYQQQFAPRSGLYDVPPPESAGWNQMSLPPPPQSMSQPPPFNNVEDQIKKEAAIESEMRHQKAALSKQREDYMKKASILKKEMETLKDQRNELRGDPKRSPSPDTKRFLKENTKLQLEIQNKLKTITNVVDMLNGIIGEGAPSVASPRGSDDSPERASTKRRSRSEDEKKFNYVYYDPEMHWCRVCGEFPPTAKDYLNHLHSASHNKMAAAHMEAPWHSVSGVNEGFPSYPSAPTKRTPIRGLQFFVPSTAWYCKLCDVFIGDLHCASAHLKSIQHSNNYTNFVEQNPHWETDWMSDRQKAVEKSRSIANSKGKDKSAYTAHTITYDKDGFHTMQPPEPPQQKQNTQEAPPPEKRKKEKKKKSKRSKRSSSSSSSSSSSDSGEKRKSKAKKRSDSAALQEWMAAMQRDDQRKLLDKIHDLKENNKRRSPERERGRDRARERDRQQDNRNRSPRSRSQRRSPQSDKKPAEIRKMPFIGKMPIYKNLSKKTEEEKKKEEESKKKQGDSEASKRRQQEMDAEIQKKVAEFKQKIAKAQLERQSEHVLLPPPPLMHHPPMPMCPVPAPAPALAQDFQDALDIIFPPDVKQHAAELVSNQDFLMHYPLPGAGASMPGAGLLPNPFLPPGMPPLVLNHQLFQPRPQVFPMVQKNNQQKNYQNRQGQGQKKSKPTAAETSSNGTQSSSEQQKKKEEMDDMAMLGIDASDVGAM